MKSLLVTISTVFLAFSPPARAGSADAGVRPGPEPVTSSGRTLEVCPIVAESRVAEPRRTVTNLFFVTNNSSQELEVTPYVGLPEGWLVIAGDWTLHVGPRQRGMSLVSVLVPRTAQPGHYYIRYNAGVTGRPDLDAWCTVPIVVLPVMKLEVSLVGAPDFIVAGDEYRASFAVSNRGNTAADVLLRTETAYGLPFVLESRALAIPPGRTQVIEIRLGTDPEIKKAIRDNVTLVAEVADPKAAAHAAGPVEVIPRITGVEDRYERIPSLLALRGVASRNGALRSRLQADISGEGSFGDGGRSHLAFLAKGPDVERIGVLGRRDEYFLTYSAGRCDIAAGDRTYAASQLTESHRYGRGLEARIKAGRLQFGAYGLRSSSDEPREQQAAACVDYALGGETHVGLNYLFKDKDRARHMLGLETGAAFAWNTDLEAEYAAGLGADPRRHAYYLRLRSTHKVASGFLRLIRADRAYPGCYQDMEFISGAVDVVLRPTSRLNASIRQERHNLVQSQLASQPTEREYQLRLNERLGITDVSLGWRTRLHEERQSQTNSDYSDYREDAVRTSIGQRFTRWNYYTALESGWTRGEWEGKGSTLQRWSASLHLRPTNRQSYGCYLSYDTSRIPGKTRKRSLTAGVTSSFRVGAGTAIDLGFRSNDYEDGRSLESNMVDLTVSQRLPGKSTVLLRGYYRPWESERGHDEIAVSLEYAVPVGVPVARRRSVGTIKGYVYDDLTGSPVEDVILRLDGSTAVTDSKGRFVFPSVPKGGYHLRLDRASIGLDRITIQKTPLEVEIGGGAETSLQIGVTRSASLLGRVVLYRSSAGGTMPSEAHKADLVEDRGLPELLLELSDGVETKRVFTDQEGRFAFTEMRPGAWTLKVPEDNLPAYTRLETSTFEFRPMPGEEIQALVRVLPLERQVQILHEGGVLKEEKPHR